MCVLVLAGLVVFGLTAVGGDLEPSAPPGPTMKTLDEVEPRIPIHASDLPLTITEPNSYYLAENINFTDDANNAITIEANDVTIDLMGYTLKGPGSGTGYGIYMNGRSNMEIRNGTVRNFGSHGIYEPDWENGKGHRVISVRAVSNVDSGIYISGPGLLVKDCTAGGNGRDGIYAPDARCTMTGNTCYNNGRYGISAGTGSTVIGNIAYGNTSWGIFLGAYCLVDQNTAYGNGASINYGDNCVIGLNVAP